MGQRLSFAMLLILAAAIGLIQLRPVNQPAGASPGTASTTPPLLLPPDPAIRPDALAASIDHPDPAVRAQLERRAIERDGKRAFFEWMESTRSTIEPQPIEPADALLPARRTVPVWEPQGPAPMLNGQIENVEPSDAVTGAVHTLAPHPNDPDILYVGAVNGGVWRTDNATAAAPDWRPLTDGLPTLSIGALDLDPTDSKLQTLLAGLGRFSSFGRAGGFLGGLIRSRDGGDTWQQLDDPLLVGQNFSGVASRGAVLLAGANGLFGDGGLFRSSDGGSSWQQVAFPGGFTPPVFDLVGDPGNASRLYLTAGGSRDESGVYRSQDAGASWTRISGGDEALSSRFNDFDARANNAELAVAAEGRLYVTVLVRGRPRYIGYSDDAADSPTPSWVALDLPLTPTGGRRGIKRLNTSTPLLIETPGGRIVGATNTAPIVVTTDLPHRLTEADTVFIFGVGGNTAANGGFGIEIRGEREFALVGSSGNGAYSAPGDYLTAHGLSDGVAVEIEGINGVDRANGVFLVDVESFNSFRLVGTVGGGSYLGGGTYRRLDGLNPREKPGSQGSLHSSIAVGPTDPETVYLGGDRQSSPFPNFIGARNFSGRLFRGDTRIPAEPDVIPSPQWEHLTSSPFVAQIPGGGTIDGSSPHADSREMAFDAAGNLLEVSDGGIFRRTLPEGNNGEWLSIASNLQTAEMHNIAYDTVANVLIGGTQDNNNSVQTAPGSLTWDNEGFSGDGGDIETARLPGGRSVRYGSAQFLFGFQRRVYDADNTLLDLSSPALVLDDGSSFFNDVNRRFVQEYELNTIDPTRGIIGTARLYESLDEFNTLTDLTGFTGFFLNGLAYGGRSGGVDNPDLIVYVTNQVFRRTTFGSPPLPVGNYPGSSAIDLVLDPDEATNIFVAEVNGQVWRTDAGNGWTEITGDLAIGELWALEYVSGDGFDQLVVGGRDGVWTMSVDRPGVWTRLGRELPRAPVYDLDYDREDDLLAAGTMGRGAWLLRDVACDRDADGDSVCDPGVQPAAAIP